MALTGDSPLRPPTKAQRPVIIAAALTTLVAAAPARALAVFADLAPRRLGTLRHAAAGDGAAHHAVEYGVLDRAGCSCHGR